MTRAKMLELTEKIYDLKKKKVAIDNEISDYKKILMEALTDKWDQKTDNLKEFELGNYIISVTVRNTPKSETEVQSILEDKELWDSVSVEETKRIFSPDLLKELIMDEKIDSSILKDITKEVEAFSVKERK